jgi:dienelactone hydrolase
LFRPALAAKNLWRPSVAEGELEKGVKRGAIDWLGISLILLTASCGDTSKPATSHGPFALGSYETTWVDTSRPTPRHGSTPELPSRSLRTVYLYPAVGTAGGAPIAGAAPERAGGPYPLVVFAHGLGASPELEMDQISALAASGFVVAAPAFPLTNSAAVGGTDGGDLNNQPGDVSFVITKTLEAASGSEAPLGALIQPAEIGVGGHSAGAVTTLGFAHPCCHDTRVKALFVWAGALFDVAEAYDFEHVPPVFFVHGTQDVLLAFNQMAEVFNQIEGSKAFLTMVGEDHASWASKSDDSFGQVLSTTIDFLELYLRNDASAKSRLEQYVNNDRYQLTVDLDPGTNAMVPLLPSSPTDRKATIVPTTGLVDGQEVAVSWSGFLTGQVVNIVQCSGTTESSCDVARGKILVPDPSGSGSTTLQVHTGPIGDGECGPGRDGCNIVVNDAGLQDPAATIYKLDRATVTGTPVNATEYYVDIPDQVFETDRNVRSGK